VLEGGGRGEENVLQNQLDWVKAGQREKNAEEMITRRTVMGGR
jgi:hypothetical protein